MQIHFLTQMLALVSLAFVASCATVDSRLDSDSRTGFISKFYSAEKLHADPPLCLRTLSTAQHDASIYVEIKIHHGRLHEYLAARVPQGLVVHVHDEVEFAPKYCAPGVVPEIKQLLRHAS